MSWLWSLLLAGGKWVLSKWLGPTTDPAKQGEKLGVAETVETQEGKEIADVNKAQSASDAVDAKLARDPDSLREPSEFSRD